MTNQVIVGAQCGNAVLRGAHVYAPGIISASKCKTLSYFLKLRPGAGDGTPCL